MATKTQTPIETLRKAVATFDTYLFGGLAISDDEGERIITDARAALEDVEALVKELSEASNQLHWAAHYLRLEERTPENDRLAATGLAADGVKARATLAKFQAQP